MNNVALVVSLNKRFDRKVIEGEVETEELYDHTKDKWEWTNLADDPEYAAIKKKMRQEIPTHHEPMGAVEAFFESRQRK